MHSRISANSVHSLGTRPSSQWNIMRLVSIFFEEMHLIEYFFIKMHGIYSFTCQVMFFILCDFALYSRKEENPEETEEDRANVIIIRALSSILFYTVFAYILSKINDLIFKERVNLSLNRLNVTNLLTWIIKIGLEWAKAFIAVLCIREQGIDYRPDVAYTVITLLYFMCTEKVFCDIITTLVEVFHFEIFDDLEYLYIPLVLNLSSVIIGMCIIFYLLLQSAGNLVTPTIYFLIYLRLKDSYFNNWMLILTEQKTLSSFRTASPREIEERDDVCPVCLNKMSKAQITPCNHLFHPFCLKQCLRSSFLCPLCKYNFKENIQ